MRRAWLPFAILLVLAAAWLLRAERRRPSAPAPPAPAAGPAPAAASPEPDGTQAPAAPEQEPPVPVDAGATAGATPFCPPDGEERYLLRHTPARYVSDVAQARLKGLETAAAERVLHAAHSLQHDLREPGYTEAERALALLLVDPAQAPEETLREIRSRARGSRDPALLVQRARVEARERREAEEEDAIRRAYELDPDDPSVAAAFARFARFDPSPQAALGALETFLRRGERIPALERQKALLEVQRDIQAGWPALEQRGVRVTWPRELLPDARASRLAHAVESALDDAARLTGTPRRARLSVFVYPGREELLAVTCVRSWATGVYDGALRLVAQPEHDLGVDPQVLRHETLHAQLRPACPRGPTWLHEGVAKVFADETRDLQGAWRAMVKSRTWIPFASLDGTFQAFDGREDAALAYAQSAALVRWMTDARGERAVARAVALFGEGKSTAEVLHDVLGPRATGEGLLEWLEAQRAADRNP